MSSRISLPEVTLLAVTSVEIDQTHAALLHCTKGIDFGAVKMCCPTLPSVTSPLVQYISTPSLDFLGYSRFIIERLNECVQTPYCLIVQADGFILDPARWRPEFLDYDYIGAPWPEFVKIIGRPLEEFRLNKNSVGNGGFSLRSKKVLEATSRLEFDRLDFPLKSEDLLICHYLYDDMCTAGIRFAPPEQAACFSIESPNAAYGQTLDTTFGFHGKQWLQTPTVLRILDQQQPGATAARKAHEPPQTANSGRIPLSRNDPCPCGSQKKFKHCHGSFAN